MTFCYVKKWSIITCRIHTFYIKNRTEVGGCLCWGQGKLGRLLRSSAKSPGREIEEPPFHFPFSYIFTQCD